MENIVIIGKTRIKTKVTRECGLCYKSSIKFPSALAILLRKITFTIGQLIKNLCFLFLLFLESPPHNIDFTRDNYRTNPREKGKRTLLGNQQGMSYFHKIRILKYFSPG